MKRFFFRLFLFALLCVAADQGLGVAFHYLRDHAQGGYFQRDNYISRSMQADVLIMGSSRAVHHYVPSVLGDSLGLACYNAGQDGCGIVYGYGKLQTVFARYYPKVLLWELTPAFDIQPSDNAAYLANLRPYYEWPGVDSVFQWVDPAERLKMFSYAYRYNSRILNLLNDYVSHVSLTSDGYLPNPGSMKYEPDIPPEADTCAVDPVKLRCLKRLIDATRGRTLLIEAASPRYLPKGYAGRMRNAAIDYVKALCRAEGIPFIDHYNDSRFQGEKQYFKDRMHLNDVGAEYYSRLVAPEIARLAGVWGKGAAVMSPME